MKEFILKYWIEVLFGGILSYAAYTKNKLKRLKEIKRKAEEEHKAKMELLHEGVMALLHDRLYQACQRYIHQGYITVPDLDNLEYLYERYHALGGNGTGTELYTRCKNLPLRQEG